VPSIENSFSRIGFADEWMETRTFPMDIVSGIDGFAQRFPTDKGQNYQNISFNGRPLFLLRFLD
jgi:hypothetical protein